MDKYDICPTVLFPAASSRFSFSCSILHSLHSAVFSRLRAVKPSKMSSKADSYGSYSGGGHSSCPEGIPVELALLSILAAFGVAFGVLYMALTVKTGRRRKRSVTGEEVDGAEEGYVGMAFQFADLFWFGECDPATQS